MAINKIFYLNGEKHISSVDSLEEYKSLRNSPRQLITQKLVDQDQPLSDGKPAKTQLIQFNYNLAQEGKLKDNNALGNSFQCDYDFHEVPAEQQTAEDKRKWVEEAKTTVIEIILAMKEETRLLMVEETRNGVHCVFRRWTGMSSDPRKNQILNLRWVDSVLGLHHDQKAEAVQQVLFTPIADRCYFWDPALFDNTPVEYDPKDVPEGWEEAAFADTCVADKTSAKMGAHTADADDEGTDDTPAAYDPEAEYNGIKFTTIIDRYFQLFNKGAQPTKGDRNAWTFELSRDLRSICGHSEKQLQRVIPNYFTDEPDTAHQEWQSAIRSGLRSKADEMGFSFRLSQVLHSLNKETTPSVTTSLPTDCAAKAVSQPSFAAAPSTQDDDDTELKLPKMPRVLPPLMRHITKNVSPSYRPFVACAALPALATYLADVQAKYWDNKTYPIIFQSVGLGRQGSGKSAGTDIVNHILRRIKNRDKETAQRQEEFDNLIQTEEGKMTPRPKEGFLIQKLPGQITTAALYQNLKDAQNNGNKSCISVVDEFQQLLARGAGRSRDELMTLIKLAYDCAESGQHTLTSVKASNLPMRWNFYANTQPTTIQRYLSAYAADGTLARLSFAYKEPNNRFDLDASRLIDAYDAEWHAGLDPYLDRLEAASGQVIFCPQANKMMKEILNDFAYRANDIDRQQSKEYGEAYYELVIRAAVIAWRAAILLYIANGYKWDSSIANFTRWQIEYNMCIKDYFFGMAVVQQTQKVVHNSLTRGGTNNLLNGLPDTFTFEQYLQHRAECGLPNTNKDSVKALIRKWRTQKPYPYIIEVERGKQWRKTPEFLSGKCYVA